MHKRASLLSVNARHQRASGQLSLSFKRRGPASVLDNLRQEGCLKARFPRREDQAWAEAVTLNSAGGVAGGDELATAITAGPGTRVTITSQAAERFYRALPGSIADVTNRLAVQPGAALEWLPQETILFDRSALRRRLAVDIAPDASFLGIESLVFGRAAMGETVREAVIDDLVEIRRAGRLLLHDRIRLAGDVAGRLQRRAIGAGAAAVATLLYAGPAAEARLDPLRSALAAYDAGASAWDGILVARIVAETGRACGGRSWQD